MRGFPVICTIVFFMSAPLLSQQLPPGDEDPVQQWPAEIDISPPPDTLVYTGIRGSVHVTTTPNIGRIHSRGVLALSTADYSRGVFDDVPSRLSDITVFPTAAIIFRIWRGENFPNHLTLTLTSQHGLTNVEYPGSPQLEPWYESNHSAGLALSLPLGLATALTYFVGTSPNAVSPFSHEINLALRYGGANLPGMWGPAVEFSIPLGQGRGAFLQLVGEPAIPIVRAGSLPLTVSFPLAFGAGLGGYHVAGEDFTGFASLGLNAQAGLGFVPGAYGRWSAQVGVELLARDDRITAATDPLDDAENVVVIGTVGIRFLY